jgi:hypothetical protein
MVFLWRFCGRGGMRAVNQEHEGDFKSITEDVNIFIVYP